MRLAPPDIQLKATWSRLKTEDIMKQIEEGQLVTMKQLVPEFQKVLKKNVGTRYFSLAQLKAMGHPYGTKPGDTGRPGGLPAGVVNYQSGQFYNSFRVLGPRRSAGRIGIYISFTGESIGRLLEEGDPMHRMRGRPWRTHLNRELSKLRPAVETLLERNLRIRIKV